MDDTTKQQLDPQEIEKLIDNRVRELQYCCDVEPHREKPRFGDWFRNLIKRHKG